MRWPWQHRHRRRNIAAVPQQLQGVELQGSAAGLSIPIVYGQARVAGKLLHMKPSLLTDTNLQYLAIAMALCEGPIAGVVGIWADKDRLDSTTTPTFATYFAAMMSLFTGTLSQAAWSFLTTNYPAEAIPYELTAYVVSPNWPVNPEGTLANWAFEVQGLSPWGGGIVDANPKDVINDFLTNSDHGAGFPSAQIASLTDFRDYCTAAGIFFGAVVDTQRPAAEILQEWIAAANSGFVWSDGKLKCVPYADQAITGNSVTYTPNTTPAYNLTDDDFIAAEGEDPILITRRPQSDVYNAVQVEFDNRANGYNTDIAEAKDQASIEQFGLKPAPVIKAPFIKTAAIARLVAQLALQRQVYLRNAYEFTLGFRYALLEPMDLVTLTDTIVGLNLTPVRITEIDENEDGSFSCTAEDWIQGVSTAPSYASVSGAGFNLPKPAKATMPLIDGSFDFSGQAILNLTGDGTASKHIYVVRTDRLPTAAETRAGTTVNANSPTGIATGTTVLPGASIYVGDFAYNIAGAESPLALRIFKREGVNVDVFGRLKQPKGDIENMVLNSGGQEGALGSQAPSWTYNSGANLVPDDTNAKFGDRSLFLTSAGANSFSHQDFSVTDQDVYELSGWIKTSSLTGTGKGAFLSIDIASGVTSFTIMEKITIGADPDSTHPIVGIDKSQTPTNFTFVKCVFRVNGSGVISLFPQQGYLGNIAGQSWFDGVNLRRVPRATNEGGYRAFNALDALSRVKRSNPFDDGKFAPKASDATGTLLDTDVQQTLAGTARALAKGYQSGLVKDGAAVTFNPVYQNLPQILLRGGKGANATYPYDDFAAQLASASGFTCKARNKNKGTITARSAEFTAPLTATSVGATVGPATLASAPSYDTNYTARFKIDVTITVPSGGGNTSVVVAVETNDGVSGWIERATRFFSATISGAGTTTASYTLQEVPIADSALGASDQIRLKLKSVSVSGPGGSTGGATLEGYDNSPGAEGHGVTYSTSSGFSDESKTPDADDYVTWEAFEVST